MTCKASLQRAKPLRIAFIISTMQPGGAQRVIAQICNFLSARNHAISLVTLESEGTPSFFPIASDVKQLFLGRKSEASAGLGRVRRILGWVSAIRNALIDIRPDVVVSFIDLTNVMTLMAVRGLRVPTIVSERIDPHHHDVGRAGAGLRRLLYPYADRIVVQTERAARYFQSYQASKLVVLANPVPPATLRAAPGTPLANGRFRIIGVGRLDRQKGFDRLATAFCALAGKHPDWDVALYGQGPEAERLNGIIADSGLASRFAIYPPTRTISAELAASHIFAFPSRYEGFPNALAEAMAAGLPSVAFREVSGVEDLIASDESGMLIDQGGNESSAAASLAVALDGLMNSGQLRTRLGEAACSRVELFAPEPMLLRWEQLIREVGGEYGCPKSS